MRFGSNRSGCGAVHLFARKVSSRCGAARILRLQSEPSAHFGRVVSLSQERRDGRRYVVATSGASRHKMKDAMMKDATKVMTRDVARVAISRPAKGRRLATWR